MKYVLKVSLYDITFEIPINNRVTIITGLSGIGKSTLFQVIEASGTFIDFPFRLMELPNELYEPLSSMGK